MYIRGDARVVAAGRRLLYYLTSTALDLINNWGVLFYTKLLSGTEERAFDRVYPFSWKEDMRILALAAIGIWVGRDNPMPFADWQRSGATSGTENSSC